MIVGSINKDSQKGKEGAREMAAMYLANKVQNIRGSADVLLQKAGLDIRGDCAHRRRDGEGRPQSCGPGRYRRRAEKSLCHRRHA